MPIYRDYRVTTNHHGRPRQSMYEINFFPWKRNKGGHHASMLMMESASMPQGQEREDFSVNEYRHHGLGYFLPAREEVNKTNRRAQFGWVCAIPSVLRTQHDSTVLNCSRSRHESTICGKSVPQKVTGEKWIRQTK